MHIASQSPLVVSTFFCSSKLFQKFIRIDPQTLSAILCLFDVFMLTKPAKSDKKIDFNALINILKPSLSEDTFDKFPSQISIPIWENKFASTIINVYSPIQCQKLIDFSELYGYKNKMINLID
eukprot:132690_1